MHFAFRIANVAKNTPLASAGLQDGIDAELAKMCTKTMIAIVKIADVLEARPECLNIVVKVVML